MRGILPCPRSGSADRFSPTTRHLMRSSLQIYSLIGTALLFLGSSTRAATFPIADGDVAGLKSAITSANANGQDDTIELAMNGTYVLTVRDNALNGLPAVAPDGGHRLTINGHGA